MKKTDEQIVRIYITHENKKTNYKRLINAISSWINNGVYITVKPSNSDEKREDIQNRLANVWKGEAAKHHHEHVNSIWGAWKLDHLLPLKFTIDKMYEEASYEEICVQAITDRSIDIRDKQLELGDKFNRKDWGTDIRYLSNRELEIKAAFINIRSKDINKSLFAEWLTLIQNVEGENGLILTAKNSDLEKALMTNLDKGKYQ